MFWIARIAAGLFGLFFIALGLGAMLDPDRIMANFNLIAPSPTGTSAVRADFGAFFIGTGAAALLGVLSLRMQWLWAALAMLLLAFFGRLVGVFFEPANGEIIQAMLVEAVGAGLMALALIMIRSRRRVALAQESGAVA